MDAPKKPRGFKRFDKLMRKVAKVKPSNLSPPSGEICSACEGIGVLSGGYGCPKCNGTGMVEKRK